MDISQYAVGAEDIDALSAFQIANFFRRHKSIAKDDCDRAAAKIAESTVSPTLVQGVASYTVIADANQCSKVVQFRRSALDLELISQARQTYGGFVPNCKAHGMLADVYVYEADLVPGVAFSRARRRLLAPAMEERLLRTVRDFARFFASAWINRGTLEPAPNTADELFAHYSQMLNQLSQKLPERFHPNHEQLRMEFWKTFYELTGDLSDDDRQAIEVGRLLGLFRTHGFDCRPEKANAAPLEEGDQEFVCLEALCLR